jgi:predicted lysophospholipase L1 biosynthesis ABC-type transport system permease subunit
VVNEMLAERYWPGENAVGKRFRLNDGQGPWVEVVGVARTAKYTAVLGPEQMFVYLPYRQHPSPVMALVTASRGDPAGLVEPLRAMVRGIDANQGIYNTRTMAENYRLRAVVIVNVIRRLIAALGVMSLTLAVVGLYGLVAFAASRRTREIGVRMAIGARRLDVLRMMFRQGATLSLCGLAVGLAISLLVNRALAATLLIGGSGAGQIDVLTFVLVATVTLASTGVAIGIPAGRATRVNPTEALRAE